MSLVKDLKDWSFFKLINRNKGQEVQISYPDLLAQIKKDLNISELTVTEDTLQDALDASVNPVISPVSIGIDPSESIAIEQGEDYTYIALEGVSTSGSVQGGKVVIHGSGDAVGGHIEFIPQPLMTASEANKFEYDGDDLFMTDQASARKKIKTIQDDSKTVAFSRKLNCLVLNNEVTLFTIPVGKYGSCGTSYSTSAFTNEFAGTLSAAATVTLSYFDNAGNAQTGSFNPATQTWFAALTQITDKTLGAGSVTAKVTAVATGATTLNIIIKGEVAY